MEAVPKSHPKKFHLHECQQKVRGNGEHLLPSSKVSEDTTICLASSDAGPVVHSSRRGNCRSHFSDACCNHEVETGDGNEGVDDARRTSIVESNDLEMSAGVAVSRWKTSR